ncbi:MAG TPA: Crp/Fnr family transcriptional regulator [Burkholderiales bacterium]|nr:Crp/Fnr family transcriptional regulator [Burkholderiales bacterium]
MTTGLLEGIIANMPMFKQVARQHLAELARHARVQHLRRGVAICRRGEWLSGFFGVAYGQVKLALRADGGEEKVLRLVGPGETFGEALVFRERPNPVDAVALTDTMLVVFPSQAILALLDRDPNFSRGLLATLSERMHNLVAEIEASTLFSARQRVAAYLESLAVESGTSRVRLPVTKTVIASRLGVTKETFSRLLRELANQGLITVDKRDILLRDRPRLAEIARPVAARMLNDKRASESSSA